jgi:acyl-coenzyme A thioesterase PaaI-like protein
MNKRDNMKQAFIIAVAMFVLGSMQVTSMPAAELRLSGERLLAVDVEGDALTSELNTAFLAPAKGEHVYCTARILKMGRRRIYGVAECHGKKGNLFSHHTLTYVRAG